MTNRPQAVWTHTAQPWPMPFIPRRSGNLSWLWHDTYSAHRGVECDDMNVLRLGARVVGTEVAKEPVSAFFKTEFSNADRHLRRLNEFKQLVGNGCDRTNKTQP
ncbi:MAG: RpiB/LacA/LacB family sugar-phosphate isomerase [Deltaproteobacteria bacterium]|nr:RpiB/LacA/LacB family sugar-phosphate isomerase [Deltaproteobacteria bacterium]